MNKEAWLPTVTNVPKIPHGCNALKAVMPAFAGPASLVPSVWLPADGSTSTVYFYCTDGIWVSSHGYTPGWVITEQIAPTSVIMMTTTEAGSSTQTEVPSPSETVATALDQDDDGSLSNGAKAGVGVGAAAAGISIIAAAVFLIRRMSRAQTQDHSSSGSVNGAIQPIMRGAGADSPTLGYYGAGSNFSGVSGPSTSASSVKSSRTWLQRLVTQTP